MAYAQPRSCNVDLYHGAVEGGCRQTRPNRGGIVESPANDGWVEAPMRHTIRGRGDC